MKTKFTVSDALLLKNGDVAITGFAEGSLPLKKGSRAVTASREIEIEVVSIGLANPPPTDSRKDILARIIKGQAPSLKGATLFFEF